MRYLEIKDFLNEDIDIRDVRVLSVRERIKTKNLFKKRAYSVMFMYISGRRQYVPSEGEPFFLNPGDVMYVPEGSAYKFCILEGDPLDYAIAVNFLMRDKSGEAVCLSKAPTVLINDTPKHYEPKFLRALATDSGTKSRTLLLKSEIYRLFHEIFTEKLYKECEALPFREILPAINKIEACPAEDTPIPELARLSGVCETKLRKLFSQYTGGLSPVQYRNRLRLEQVTRSLKTQEITVEQAAREAGFRDMAHFYRLYKKYVEKK